MLYHFLSQIGSSMQLTIPKRMRLMRATVQHANYDSEIHRHSTNTKLSLSEIGAANPAVRLLAADMRPASIPLEMAVFCIVTR